MKEDIILAFVKWKIIRSAIKNKGRAVNIIIFYFRMMLIHPGFKLPPCLDNVTKIARRTRNKIYITLLRRRNRVFRWKAFNFINWFKGDFKDKSWKNFGNFERYGRIKKKNDRTGQGLEWQTECLGFLNLFKDLRMIEWLYPQKRVRD